jgi:L-fuculose-phosphate aldolase
VEVFVLLKEERELIAEYGRKMSREKLVKGTGGNISIFSPGKKMMAISPSGKDYETISIDDVMVTDLDGNVVEGNCKPSTEWRMHAIFYKRRPEIQSVVHTHSINAAALSCLRVDLPPIYYLACSAGPIVRCAKYALNGTAELAQNALDAMGSSRAVLLANHGVLTAADNLHYAYYIAEQLEFEAELYLKCRTIGEPIALNEREVKEMLDLFDNLHYGQAK